MTQSTCPREEFFRRMVKKMMKGKTNKERRLYRRVIKEAKKDGSYPALVNEVLEPYERSFLSNLTDLALNLEEFAKEPDKQE